MVLRGSPAPGERDADGICMESFPMNPIPAAPRPLPALPWEELRALSRQRARSRLADAGTEDVEDVVQLAMVRLIRACRAADVANPHGLTSTVTDRAAQDWIRARRRWRARFEQPPEVPEPQGPQAVAGELGDPLERVRFVVMEYFGQTDGPCAELATAYFESRDWAAVATASGLAATTVRKRWWRCVEQLRSELRGPLEPLFEAFLGGRA